MVALVLDHPSVRPGHLSLPERPSLDVLHDTLILSRSRSLDLGVVSRGDTFFCLEAFLYTFTGPLVLARPLDSSRISFLVAFVLVLNVLILSCLTTLLLVLDLYFSVSLISCVLIRSTFVVIDPCLRLSCACEFLRLRVVWYTYMSRAWLPLGPRAVFILSSSCPRLPPKFAISSFPLAHVHWQYCLKVLVALESHVFKQCLFSSNTLSIRVPHSLFSFSCVPKSSQDALSLSLLLLFFFALTIFVGLPAKDLRSELSKPSYVSFAVLKLTSLLL